MRMCRACNNVGDRDEVNLEAEGLGLLPRVLGVAEVTIGGGLQVLRPLETELTYNDTWPQVPVFLDDLDEFLIGLGSGLVCIDVDRERFGDTNGIRKLDEGTAGQSASNERLGY
jgi:hypothetical protein